MKLDKIFLLVGILIGCDTYTKTTPVKKDTVAVVVTKDTVKHEKKDKDGKHKDDNGKDHKDKDSHK